MTIEDRDYCEVDVHHHRVSPLELLDSQKRVVYANKTVVSTDLPEQFPIKRRIILVIAIHSECRSLHSLVLYIYNVS